MDLRTFLFWGLAVWLSILLQDCNAAVTGRQDELSSSPSQNPDPERLTASRGTLEPEKTREENIGNLKDHPTNDAKKDSNPDSLLSNAEFSEDGIEEEDTNGVIRGNYSYIEDGVPAIIEYEAVPGTRFLIKNYIKGSKNLPVPEIIDNPEDLETFDDFNDEQDEDENNSGKDSLIPTQNSNINQNSFITLSDPVYEHATVLGKYDSKTLTRKVRTINDQEGKEINSASSEIEVTDYSQVDKSKAPVDASYRFGFSADGQTRSEEADAQGNVHGSYSYIGENGILNKVEYEAGSGKGFIVKRITQEDTSKSDKQPQNHILMNHSNNKLNSEIETSSSITSENLEVKSEDHKIQSYYMKASDGVSEEQKNDKGEEENKEKSNMKSDGSYSFSYKTPSHWREESVDSKGHVKSRFSYIAQGRAKTLQSQYDVSPQKYFDLPIHAEAPSSIPIPALTNLNTHNLKMNNDGSYSFSYKTPNQFRVEVVDKKLQDSSVSNKEAFSQENQKSIGGMKQSGSHDYEDDTTMVDSASPIENDGSYSYSYKTPDQMRQEAGDVNGNVQGQYSYVADDGIRRAVQYKASPESGFTAVESSSTENSFVLEGNGSSKGENQESSREKEYSASQNLEDNTATINNASQIENDGSYSYSYETSDQARQETGTIGGNIQGQYSYIADDGIRRTVDYKASPESGFTAEGSHLPSNEDRGKTVSGALHTVETEPGIASSKAASHENSPTNEIISSENGVGTEETQYLSNENIHSDGLNSFPKTEHTLYSSPNTIPTVGFITEQVSEDSPQMFLDLSGIRRAAASKGTSRIQKHKKIIKKRPIEPTTQNFANTQPDGSYSFVYNTKDQLRREAVDTTGNVYSNYQYKTKDGGRTVVVFLRKSVKDPASGNTRTARNMLSKPFLEYDNDDRSYQRNEVSPSGKRTWLPRKRHVQLLSHPGNNLLDQRQQFVQPALKVSQVNSELKTHSDRFDQRFISPTATSNGKIELKNYRIEKSVVKPFRGNVKYNTAKSFV